MSEFYEGEYIVYRNGEKYELGRIASLREDGAFVCYHEGETAAKTPYDHMHKLINAYAVKATSLGGDRFQKGGEETLLPDGTLHITVDIDVSKVVLNGKVIYGEDFDAQAESEDKE